MVKVTLYQPTNISPDQIVSGKKYFLVKSNFHDKTNVERFIMFVCIKDILPSGVGKPNPVPVPTVCHDSARLCFLLTKFKSEDSDRYSQN